ncbi:MAG: UDP-N-acetylglucosamine acyltransferase [Methylophagaceae bacterium]|jgi:UDP-N-acetylglucosamine acyltransferase
MIHKTAIIEPTAVIADNVKIGAYSIIGANVEIGTNCVIGPHVVINGPTKIGNDNKIYQFSSIGEDPQDKKYAGEPTLLEIGNNNLIRECVTINRGTVQGGGITKMGNNNWIMAYVHIAHDCILGNENIIANNTSLAGHVAIDDFVILGGFSLISQFNKIGSYAFSAMGSVISRNVPPYVLVSGHMAKPIGVNVEGLRRRQFSDQQIKNIKQAYKLVYRSGLRIEEAELKLEQMSEDKPELAILSTFLNMQQGGIIR